MQWSEEAWLAVQYACEPHQLDVAFREFCLSDSLIAAHLQLIRHYSVPVSCLFSSFFIPTLRAIRGLPYMTFTTFWDFLASSLLFVVKIYTLCPQISCISWPRSVPPTPHSADVIYGSRLCDFPPTPFHSRYCRLRVKRECRREKTHWIRDAAPLRNCQAGKKSYFLSRHGGTQWTLDLAKLKLWHCFFAFTSDTTHENRIQSQSTISVMSWAFDLENFSETWHWSKTHVWPLPSIHWARPL